MRSIQNVRTNVIPYLKRFAARRGLNMIIDNQKNGLETQAKASMLLTRHP